MSSAYLQRQNLAEPLATFNRPRGLKPAARFARTAAVLLIALAFTHNAYITWDRCGDLVIDTGRELDVPVQILSGKTLYADIRYWYGPLAPYLNAAMYGLFGVHTRTLAAAGMISIALLAAACYRILRRFTGRAEAATAISAMLYINAFGHLYQVNIFNFVLPYTFAATYGMVICLWSLLQLIRYLRCGRTTCLIGSCVLLGLSALCKLEIVFALACVHGVFMIGSMIARRASRSFFIAYGLAAAIPAIVYGAFYMKVGRRLLDDNLLTGGNLSVREYYLRHAGLEHPIKALGEIGTSLAALAVCALLLWIATKLDRTTADHAPVKRSGRSILIGLGAAAAGALMVTRIGCLDVFRGLPVLLIGLLVVAAYRVIRGRGPAYQSAALGLIAVFGLASLVRVIGNTGAAHYGFVLSVPGILALCIISLGLLPNKPAAGAGRRSTAVRIAGCLMLAAIAYDYHAARAATLERLQIGREATFIEAPRGRMVVPVHYRGSIDWVVSSLAALPPGQKIVVLPEGAAITFLSGGVNPLGVHTFLPLDFCGSYCDADMPRRLAPADPDVIVITSRSTREFGKVGLGEDYGLAMMAWVRARYKIVQRYDTATFGAMILMRGEVKSILSEPGQ